MDIDDDDNNNNNDMPALVPVHPAWIQDINNDNIHLINNFNLHLNPLEIPDPFPGHILNLELDLTTLEAALMANGINNDFQDWVRAALRWILKTTTETALLENPIEPHVYINAMSNIYGSVMDALVAAGQNGESCQPALAGMSAGLYSYVEWLEHSTVAEIRATVADLEECLFNVVIDV